MKLDYETPEPEREPPNWWVLWAALSFGAAALILRFVLAWRYF
jgi:hypothetical protein